MNKIKNFLSSILTLILKDYYDEVRKKENILSSFFFGLISTVIYSFFISQQTEGKNIEIGFFFFIVLLGGTIYTKDSIKKEEDNETIYALMLSPVDRSSIFLGKTLINCFFLFIFEFYLLILLFLFEDFKTKNLIQIILVLFFFNLGFSSTGVLISSFFISNRKESFLYPLILYPLLIPLSLSTFSLIKTTLENEDLNLLLNNWFKMLIAFDIIFISITSLFFEVSLEE